MTSDAPCRSMADRWRECLKASDYSPDRNETHCESERVAYYSCINEWRKTQGGDGRVTQSNVPAECSGRSNALHECMKLSMFTVEQCQKEMAALRECVHRVQGTQNPSEESDKKLLEPPRKRLWFF